MSYSPLQLLQLQHPSFPLQSLDILLWNLNFQVIESFHDELKNIISIFLPCLLNCVDWSSYFNCLVLFVRYVLYPEHRHYQYHHDQNYLLSCYVTCNSLQDQHHMVSMKSISARNCGVSNSNLTWKNADRCSNCFSIAGRIFF